MVAQAGSPDRAGADRPARAATVGELACRDGVDLVRFAYLLCGDRQRAEDLVQDVLLAMHRRFPDELPLDNPVGYARRALANTNVSRARKLSSTELAVETLPDTGTVELDDPADRDLLWRAMRHLTVRQRTVLVLRYYADASDTDIATTLGTRRGTVRSLASRALAALRTDPTLSAEATSDTSTNDEDQS